MLLLYILWDDWPIFMISGSNEQLQQQLEYTLLKPDCYSWWISKMQSGREDTLEKRYAIKFCFKLRKNAMWWKLDLLLWPRDQETEFPVEACWLSQTQEGQTEQIHPQTFDNPFFDTTGMIYTHWVPTGQTVNKEYYVEVLREFSKRFRRKRPALFKSGQWHFHQDNAPIHNFIIVTGYLTKMGIKTVAHHPYRPDLAPLVIPSAQSLSLWDNWEDERGCDEGHWYAHTRGLPRGLPEVVGTVQQVHCSRRRLLRRRLEFHVCTINKSAHTKSLETYLMILVLTYIYIYIYFKHPSLT